MRENIRVSVIVLTYNHERYIRRALDSVLSQRTAFPYEVLVGDDGSTDQTARILREYQQDGRGVLRLFLRKDNVGGTANLAGLLRCAEGKYIASCEGDDYWTDPGKLQKQVDFLESHTEYVGCTHPITLVDQNGVPCRKQSLWWIKDKAVFRLSDFQGIYLPGHPVSMVYRNIFAGDLSAVDLIARVHPQIGDRTIAMLLSLWGDIARLEDTMACYRQMLSGDSGSLTAREFASNPLGKLTDMQITNRLEAYLRKERHLSVHFNSFRCRLVLRTLAKAVLCASPAAFACLGNMVNEWRIFQKEMKQRG